MWCGDSEVRKQTHGNRKLAIRVVGGEEQNKRWGVHEDRKSWKSREYFSRRCVIGKQKE